MSTEIYPVDIECPYFQDDCDTIGCENCYIHSLSPKERKAYLGDPDEVWSNPIDCITKQINKIKSGDEKKKRDGKTWLGLIIFIFCSHLIIFTLAIILSFVC